MTVLDTNVVSEPTKPAPHPAVEAWFQAQSPDDLFITSITAAELLSGVAALADGRRKRDLAVVIEQILRDHLPGRILPFDQAAAREFATIIVGARRAGRPIAALDAMIAAIAKAHGARLATRNTADFEGCGIALVNPWQA